MPKGAQKIFPVDYRFSVHNEEDDEVQANETETENEDDTTDEDDNGEEDNETDAEDEEYLNRLTRALCEGDVSGVREHLDNAASVTPYPFRVSCVTYAITVLAGGMIGDHDYDDAPEPPYQPYGEAESIVFTRDMHEAFTLVIQEGGVDVNHIGTDSNEESALTFAARTGNVDLLRCLVENGASTIYLNNNGYSALNMAIIYNHHDAVVYLDNVMPPSVGDHPVAIAAHYGNRGIIRRYLEPDSVPSTRITSSSGFIYRLRNELQQPRDTPMESINIALMEALEACHVPSARLLLAHGADPSWIDSIGGTAVHLAAEKGLNTVLFDMLFKYNARPVYSEHNNHHTPIEACLADAVRDTESIEHYVIALMLMPNALKPGFCIMRLIRMIPAPLFGLLKLIPLYHSLHECDPAHHCATIHDEPGKTTLELAVEVGDMAVVAMEIRRNCEVPAGFTHLLLPRATLGWTAQGHVDGFSPDIWAHMHAMQLAKTHLCRVRGNDLPWLPFEMWLTIWSFVHRRMFPRDRSTYYDGEMQMRTVNYICNTFVEL